MRSIGFDAGALRQQDVAGVHGDRGRRDFGDEHEAVLAGLRHHRDDRALGNGHDVFGLKHADGGAADGLEHLAVFVVAQHREDFLGHVHARDAGHVEFNADGQVAEELHGRTGVRRADSDGVAEDERQVVLCRVVRRVRDGPALVGPALHQEAEGAPTRELGAVAVKLAFNRRDDRVEGGTGARRRRGLNLHD